MFVASLWSCAFLLLNVRNPTENDPKTETVALGVIGCTHMINFALLMPWVLYH